MLYRAACFFLFAFFVCATYAHAEIKIAVVCAMSGQFESVGMKCKQGVRGAVDAINGAGGLLGEQIVILERVDECKPEKAAEFATELSNSNVALFVGHLCSGASIAASEIYAKHGIVQITPTSTAPQLTERGLSNVFRTCGRDDMQGFVVAEHIVRKYPAKKVGIGYDETVYSTELAKITKGFLNKNGVKEEFFISIPKEKSDFTNILQKISEHKVDVLFFPSYAGIAINLLKQAKKKGVEFKFVSSDSLMTEDFLKFAKSIGDEAERIEISYSPNPAHDRRNRKLTPG